MFVCMYVRVCMYVCMWRYVIHVVIAHVLNQCGKDRHAAKAHTQINGSHYYIYTRRDVL